VYQLISVNAFAGILRHENAPDALFHAKSKLAPSAAILRERRTRREYSVGGKQNRQTKPAALQSN
jgi:hypothetical protein